MANDVSQQTDNAFDTIVKLTDQSANMKKELKKSIHVTVSNLRNLIFILKENVNERTSEKSQPQNEVNQLKKEMEAHRNLHPTGLVVPSVDNTSVPTRGGNMPTKPSSEGRKKLYAEALSGKKGNLFKLTVKHRNNEHVDAVKKILKSSTD